MRERRKVQRYEFEVPPAAVFGMHRVFVADLSIHGAAIHHDAAVAVGGEGRLNVNVGGERLSIECEVLSCRLRGHVSGHRYRTSLRFTSKSGVIHSGVKQALENLVAQRLERERSHPDVALSA